MSSTELGKYEYLTGEDLGYKPGVVEKVKFKYCPLGEVLSKVLKKMIKSTRLLNTTVIWCIVLCITVNKYSVSNFSEISSRDSKFNTLNKFYKDFKKLEDVKSQTNETKQKKTTVLKNSSVLYDMLIKIYRKEYNQVFKSKDENWRQKHDYKNLKDLNYQPDQIQPGQPQQSDQSRLPTWVKATKSRFNEIQSIITEA